jgi:hypothetical protein
MKHTRLIPNNVWSLNDKFKETALRVLIHLTYLGDPEIFAKIVGKKNN